EQKQSEHLRRSQPYFCEHGGNRRCSEGDRREPSAHEQRLPDYRPGQECGNDHPEGERDRSGQEKSYGGQRPPTVRTALSSERLRSSPPATHLTEELMSRSDSSTTKQEKQENWWEFCPVCGSKLLNHKCRFVCSNPQCQFFMSCSEFDL